MDKTFNDLMSIVNRTKKIDEKEGRPSRRVVKKVEEPEEEIQEVVEVVEETPKKKATKKASSLFDGAEAINKLVSSDKKKTPAKKTTKKPTAKSEEKEDKKSTTKKSADKINNLAKNIKKTPAKESPKTPPTTNTDIDLTDPKNAQLYEALHSSLFSQGTDISQYMEGEENSEQQSQLAELKKQREAMKLSQEISKEQQEYEQLFTGGFMGGEEEVSEETEEARESLSKDRLSNIQNIPKPTPRPAPRPQKSSDVDKKIADYYRRKQEMIDKFNKEQYAESYKEEKELSSYEQRQSEYEDVFNNAVYNSQSQNAEEKEDVSLEENLENIEEYENAEILQEEDEEKREIVFDDYDDDDEEENVRRMSNYKFPTNSPFEDIDSEYALIKRGALDDNIIKYNEEDLAISSRNENSEENSQTESVEETSEIQESIDTPIEETSTTSEDVSTDEQLENNEIIESTEDVEDIEDIEEVEDNQSENVDDAQLQESSDEQVDENENNIIEEVSEEDSSESNDEIFEEENKEILEENLTEEIDENISSESVVGQVEENIQTLEDNENTQEDNIEETSLENEVIIEEVEETPIESEEIVDSSEGEDEEVIEESLPDEETFENTLTEESQEDTPVEENEYANSIINEYSEEEKDENYNMTDGEVSDYIIASNTPIDEEKITSETSVFNQDIVYEEDVSEENSEDVEHSEDNAEIQENSDVQADEREDVVAENVEETSEDIIQEERTFEENEIEENSDDNNDIDNESYENMTDDDISEYVESEVITTEDVNDQLYDAHLNDIEEESEIINTPQDDDDDNTMIIDGDKFVSELSLYPEMEEESEEVEEEVEEKVEVEEEKDTISKEEFYNEMARLQENLLSELKGQKVENNSIDYFKEEEKEETDDFDEYITFDNTNGEDIPANSNDEESPSETTEENDEVDENAPANKLAMEIINDWKEREGLIEKSEESEESQEKENEDAVIIASEIENGMNLLNLENPLDEGDLKYQEESEKEKEIVKDNYFYLSAEDTEKKAIVEDDEYVKMYNEEISGIYEVGDINLNKDIQNAVPYSRVDTEDEKRMKKEKEIELIYTLFGMEKKEVSKEKEDLKVLYVAGECQPFIATGGLADVAGSLPKAIAEKGGVDIRVILPLCGNIKKDFRDKFEYLGNFTVHLSWRQEYCGLFRYYSDGVTYYFIDNERYFKRDKTFGYFDDGERFAYFSKAIVECLPYINFFPDIIHCNDWHSALVSAYIKTGNWSDFRYYKIKHIYTIHNVEYQGVYGMDNLKDLFGIDPRFRNDMDYNGDINLTKAAIQFSDKFTTVSNSYCDNLKQPYCSRGLHHIIIRNDYKLSGIVNGLDYDFYNPETDKVIYKNFNINSIQDKVMNKKVWQDELGLPVDGDTPMISMVTRLVSHKGLDLVTKILEKVLQKDVQFVVVGTGDQKYMDYFKNLEERYPTKVRVFVDKFSNELARIAYAASDIFIMPSKVEPCGISQMVASRYGSVPIVREVGGLKDTITDFGCEGGGNGYTFTNYNPDDLEYQINRALVDYTDKESWKKKIETVMSQDFTWAKSADKYIELYNSVVK